METRGSRLAEALSWILLMLAVIIGIGLVALLFAAILLALGGFGGLLSRLAADGTTGIEAMTALIVIAGLTTAAALPLVLLLRRVLLRVARGAPFHPGTPRDLQLVAGLLAVLEVVSLIGYLVVPLLIRLPQEIAADMRADFEFDLTSWLAVLIILVLAEVFREGARLRADAELTV